VVIAADVQRVWEHHQRRVPLALAVLEYASAEILETAENYVRFRLTTCRTRNGGYLELGLRRRLDRPPARSMPAGWRPGRSTT